MFSFPIIPVSANACISAIPSVDSLAFPMLVNSPTINCFPPIRTCVSPSNSLVMNESSQIVDKSNICQNSQFIKFGIPQLCKNNLVNKIMITSNSKNNKIVQLNVKNENSNSYLKALLDFKNKPRSHFSKEEDEKIKELVKTFGKKNWSVIALFMKGRSAKQCRDRYCNYLIPGYFNGEWSKEEDELLLKLYNENGSKWSLIQSYFPKRSSNSIKNRWFYFLRKKDEKKSMNQKSIDSKIDFDDFGDDIGNDEFDDVFQLDKELVDGINENEWIGYE